MIPSIFQQDWFDRSSDFVSKQKSSVENILNDQFSKFLYTESEISKILATNENLRKECKSILSSINVNKVQVNVTENTNEAWTDGTTVSVTRKFKTNYDDYDLMDLVIGLSVHEGCHCLYTDFKHVQYCSEKYGQAIHHLSNILEDELIEQRLGHNHAGYVKFLSKVKTAFFGKREECTSEQQKVMELLFGVVRYPKILENFDEKFLDKYADLFEKIYKIMQDTDCFNTNNEFCTRSSFAAAIRIWELLKKVFEIEEQQQELTLILEKLDKSFPYKDANSSNDENDEKSKHPKYKAKECVINEISSSKRANREKYNKLFSNVKNYLNKFRKTIDITTISSQSIANKYVRNGSLDSSCIANALAGCQNVYKQYVTKRIATKANFALAIILDESGSIEYAKLADKITELAILMYESMASYPNIEIYVYGYGDTVHRYISKFERNKYALGARHQQESQNDEVAYRMIFKDIRKQTQLPIIAFSLTDMYFASANMEFVINDIEKDNTNIFVVNLAKSSYSDDENESLKFKNRIIRYNEDDTFDILCNKVAKTIKKYSTLK